MKITYETLPYPKSSRPKVGWDTISFESWFVIDARFGRLVCNVIILDGTGWFGDDEETAVSSAFASIEWFSSKIWKTVLGESYKVGRGHLSTYGSLDIPH